MRVVFETPAVPAVDVQPNGQRLEGTARFVARTFEPDEEIPPGHHPAPISDWLRSLRPGAPMRDTPPPNLTGPAPAVVPRELLEALPGDALYAVEWEFIPRRTRP